MRKMAPWLDVDAGGKKRVTPADETARARLIAAHAARVSEEMERLALEEECRSRKSMEKAIGACERVIATLKPGPKRWRVMARASHLRRRLGLPPVRRLTNARAVVSSWGEEWPCVADVTRATGAKETTVFGAIKNGNRCMTAGGRVFWFKGDSPPEKLMRALILRSDGKVFPTIREAAKSFGFAEQDIRNAEMRLNRALNRRLPFEGFMFERVHNLKVLEEKKAALQIPV